MRIVWIILLCTMTCVSAQVIITEVNSTANSYASYVELLNIGNSPIDLSGYTLTYGNEGSDKIVDEPLNADGYSSGLVLAPGEFFLVIRSQSTFSETYPEIVFNTGDDDAGNSSIEFMMHGSLYLNGGADYLQLKDGGGTLKDAFSHAAAEWPDNHCFERSAYPNDGTDWQAHWTDLGANVAGTPGRFNDTSLPVRLVSFSARQTGEGVEIEWHTESEFEIYGFYLYRRDNLLPEYRPISPLILPQGGPSTGAIYRFLDRDLPSSGEVWYILHQVDLNGRTDKYGPIVICRADSGVILGAVPERLRLQAFPNPFNPSTQLAVEIDGVETRTVALLVSDLLGRQVRMVAEARLAPGSYRFLWHGDTDQGESAAAGIYFGQLIDSNDDRALVRLIKVP